MNKESIIKSLYPGRVASARFKSKCKVQRNKPEFVAYLSSIQNGWADHTMLDRWLTSESYLYEGSVDEEHVETVREYIARISSGENSDLFYQLGCMAILTGLENSKHLEDDLTFLEREGLVMLLSLQPAKGEHLVEFFDYARTTGFIDKDSGDTIPTEQVLRLTLYRQMVKILLKASLSSSIPNSVHAA